MKAWIEKLNGTVWTLELRPTGGQGPTQADTVRFEGRQVTSEQLAKSGYPRSNFTLTLRDDDVVVWETMQTKEGEGVVFWRGEVRGAQMSGMMSRQPAGGGPSEDFSFTASKRDVAAPTQPSAASSASSTKPTTKPAEPALPEPPKQEKKQNQGRF